MVVLRAIGRFFAKIGRWIRDTAWVQPLLIVGGIFAIIFSIPYLTKWVGSWFAGKEKYIEWYEKYQLSLDGCDKEKSKADTFMKYIEDVKNGEATDAQKKKYGEKFFLAFVQEGCAGCEDNYGGFSYLASHYTTKDQESQFYLDSAFKIHTIFTDDVDSDIDYDGNIFDHYFYQNNLQFFETACEIATDEINYNYLINQGGKSSTYYKNAEGLAEEVDTPVVLLIDTSSIYAGDYGIREVLFNFSGKDDGTNAYSRALTLADAWNGNDIFSENYKK